MATPNSQYLSFALQGVTYAVNILNIKEIIAYMPLTFIPMMPTFIRGVLNLRGKIVPVVDLLARFNQGNTRIAARTSIIIIELIHAETLATEQPALGIMVDTVNTVLDINTEQLSPPPHFGTHIRADFIHGLLQEPSRLITVLAIEHVLSLTDMLSYISTEWPHKRSENQSLLE